MSDVNAEGEYVLRHKDGTIEAVQLPREIARKVAIYRKIRELGLTEEEARFLLTAGTF